MMTTPLPHNTTPHQNKPHKLILIAYCFNSFMNEFASLIQSAETKTILHVARLIYSNYNQIHVFDV